MKKLMIGLVAAALLPLSAAVQAKTICLNTFGSSSFQLKLVGVASLKKPGSVSALKGIYREGSLVGPVTGSAMTNADGTVTVGLTWLLLGTSAAKDITFGGSGLDQNLVGTFSYSNDDDLAPESTFSTSILNCKEFLVAPAI